MPSIAKFDQWQSTSGVNKETIIQVKQTHLTGRYSQSIPSVTATDITDLNVTITPSSTTSRILLLGRWTGEYGSTGQSWNSVYGFKRNGTRIGDHNITGTATTVYGIGLSALTYYADDANSTPDSMTMFYIDSPATTSAITYQIFISCETGFTLYTNRTLGWTTSTTTGHEATTSTIIAMEIAA